MSTQTYEATQPAEEVYDSTGTHKEPYCDVVLQLVFDPLEDMQTHTNYTVNVLYLPRRNETRNPAIWDTLFLLDNSPIPNAPSSVRFPAFGSQTLTAGTPVPWYTMSLRLKNDGAQHKLSFSGVCKTTAPRFFPNYQLSITFTTPVQKIIPFGPTEYNTTYDEQAHKLTYRWEEATNAVRYTLSRKFYYSNAIVDAGDFVSTNSGTTSLTYEEIANGEVCETDRNLLNGLVKVRYEVTSHSSTGYATTMPYQEYTMPSDTSKVFVKVNGTWRRAIPWVKVNGVWKKAKAWVKVNGVWKSTNS